MGRRRLPKRLEWLFWNADLDQIDLNAHADMIIAAIVEWGRLEDVRWALRHYGRDRIHDFFRNVGSPEVSDRTVAFWRAVFRAEDEEWPRPAAWRRSSSAPWVE
ncbi:MAG: hypothetical protein HYV07_06770 [Deltaproteobacteria bacterium]|nr:hypothetical protein [Deltaproteobacteria bacterium]